MTQSDQTQSDHILTENRAGILHVQMNRPKKKNALTKAMYATIADAIEQSNNDSSVRVLLLSSTSEAFTAGNDIMDFVGGRPPQDEASPVVRFLRNISQAQKPIVAAVSGLAVGVGTTMLLHCDLVYASTRARLHLPFVSLGLVPEAASTYLLPRMVGHQRASELFLLGEPFSAQEGAELGIVNRVCEPEALLAQAYAAAEKLAVQPPAAVRLTKRLLRENGRFVQQAMAREGEAFQERLHSPEAAEAFAAFLERRKPDFSKFS